jgi:hypothetical protein
MRFHNGVVLTQAQWDKKQNERPKIKLNYGTLMAVVAGLTITSSMGRSSPQLPPTNLDDLD